MKQGGIAKAKGILLVISHWLLPVDATEASSSYFHLNASLGALATSSPGSSQLVGARNMAYDPGVSNLEAAGAVGGGLGRYPGADAAKLVPPPAVQTQQREGI
jgi:hypothetical protein